MIAPLSPITTEYEWELTPDYVPPHIKNLPKAHGFSIVKLLKFNGIVLQGLLGFLWVEGAAALKALLKGNIKFQRMADLGLLEAARNGVKWRSLEDFNQFFKPWTSFAKPKVADTWDRDDAFAQARLCGINPAFIRKCRPEDLQVEGKFPVTEGLVGHLLPSGLSLATALADEKLYLIDYKILSDILPPEGEDQLGRYAVSPLCLLVADEQAQLMPLAIRLYQEDRFQDLKINPILTPDVAPERWLTAKVAVSSADIAYQGLVSHLLNTHLIIETFAITTFRSLSPNHIIYQLLQPHFFNTFAINEMARGVFLGHGGLFDFTGALGYTGSNNLLQRAYTGTGVRYEGHPHLFYRTALPVDLACRDVMNLPGYHYRDDALLIWDAIQTYVTDILKLHYQSAEDLKDDNALQDWKTELVSPNHGRLQGLLPPEKSAQITGPLTDLEDLITILTTVIFTASAQHSAVNFGQYEYAGFVPNMPFALYQPFTDILTDDPAPAPLVSRLPNRLQSILQMVLVKTLSMPTPHSSPSLLTMTNPFQDVAARKVFQDFQGVHLPQIEMQITQRNKSVKHPYVRLLPSKIAQSIAI
jgi:hypothetical protein